MDYKEIRSNIEHMANENYSDFIKAIISYEKGINDEKSLESIYQSYMENDTQGLLNDEFDYMIDNLKEQGMIMEEAGVKEERDDLINIIGNIFHDVEKLDLTNNQGEAFSVMNFTVVSNDDSGEKVFHNCSAYGNKGKIAEEFKKGDFVKLFGQVRRSIDENGKEHTNVRILDSKLLKLKERKESILGAIKKHKEADKEKGIKKAEHKHENER